MIATANKQKIKKYLIRIFLGILIFLFLALGSGSLLIYYNQDSIKKIFISEINKSLQTEISVKDIEFSIFDKFPNASLCFKEIVAKDATTDSIKDTLLIAKSLYLEFNIMDLYYKQYRIKNIELNDAAIKLKVDIDGNDNYHFWKPSTNQDKTTFNFSLKKVSFNNVNIKYFDKANQQYYDILLQNAMAKGDFSNDIQVLNLKGDLVVHHFQSGDMVYFKNEKAKLDVGGNINTLEKSVEILHGNLMLNDLSFLVNGKIFYAENHKTLQLKITGNDLKLHHFIKEFPEKYQSYLNNYESKGKLNFTMDISGEYGNEHFPLVTADFNLQQGEIYHKTTKARLSNVVIKGNYSNAENTKEKKAVLSIQQFACRLKNGTINASFTYTDFNNPYIDCNANASLELNDVAEFVKSAQLKTMQGKLVLNLNYKGKVNTKALKIADFINSQTTGQASLSNVQVELNNDTRTYRNFNAVFNFTNNDIEIQSFSGNISNSDLSMKGYFRNVIPYLFLENQKIEINADLYSNNMDVDELMNKKVTNTSRGEFQLSDNYNFSLLLHAKKIKYKKFNAANVSGKLSYLNHVLKAEDLEMESLGGKIKGILMVDGSQKGKFLISCDINTEKINATQAFYVFDDFGQNSMKANNISGLITANIQFAALFNLYLQIDKKTIWSKINLKIENGKLINYPPLMKLSKFIDADDLKEVNFKTLQNQIIIKDENISIPAMEIQSSAINLGIAGEHQFSNTINYRIQLLLSELSSKKRKLKKQQQQSNQEFGYEEDDGLGRSKLFLKVTGTIDNPHFSYDTKGLKEKLKLDFKNEKTNLNNILKEEFKWLRRDSAEIIQQQRFKIQEKGKFVIDWDEETKEKPKKTVQKDSLPQSKTKIKWDD
ncbi:MAG: hypothetical protein NTZ33_11760 [Bacteroidetes bacterium]|nr:hypothetical protein [Bacteroidota bacterium]